MPPTVHGQPAVPVGHAGPASTQMFDKQVSPGSQVSPSSHGHVSVPDGQPVSALAAVVSAEVSATVVSASVPPPLLVLDPVLSVPVSAVPTLVTVTGAVVT